MGEGFSSDQLKGVLFACCGKKMAIHLVGLFQNLTPSISPKGAQVD